MRVAIEVPGENIVNCRDCIFSKWRGYECNPERLLCNFRCTLLDVTGVDYPHTVQSAKPGRPEFCPIKRITKTPTK